MGYQTILFERDGKVAKITINRPDAMNSMTQELSDEMAEAVRIAELDRGIRALIITGSGTRSFCAGADMKALLEKTSGKSEPLFNLADHMHEHIVVPIRRMAKPVLAAMNGVAVGGGLGLALSCDLRVAANTARMMVAYSNIAVSPDVGTSFFLPRLVGVAKAMELYLFNEMLTAEKAKELGLINRVVPETELQAATMEMAQQLASGPSMAIGETKQLFNRAFLNDLQAHLSQEAHGIAMCSATEDHRSGVEAFVAKRKPVFNGR